MSARIDSETSKSCRAVKEERSQWRGDESWEPKRLSHLTNRREVSRFPSTLRSWPSETLPKGRLSVRRCKLWARPHRPAREVIGGEPGLDL